MIYVSRELLPPKHGVILKKLVVEFVFKNDNLATILLMVKVEVTRMYYNNALKIQKSRQIMRESREGTQLHKCT